MPLELLPLLRCYRLLLLSAVGFLTACGSDSFERIEGQTMGTYFAVSYESDRTCKPEQAGLLTALAEVNQSMSTYLPDSELSRFNTAPDGAAIPISPQLEYVLRTAYAVWDQSGGAFDVTVGPLVNLWGFGPQLHDDPPDLAQRRATAAHVGMDKLELSAGTLRKLDPEVYVDLSALAKGYGVDVLAELMSQQGCRNFMVDIGGEIRAHGVSRRGQPWRVGIEEPSAERLGSLHTVLVIADMSVATSGDYRNYRVIDGRRVGHVIDPRSGEPANNRIVSSTVVHQSAMWADAYATALMVLGWDAGFRLAEQLDLPVYLMRRGPDDAAEAVYESRYNAAMQNFLVGGSD